MKMIQWLAVCAALSFCMTSKAASPEYVALADSVDKYIKQERWLEAETSIISALKLEPANFSNSLLFSNLGVVRTNQGKMNDALEAFRLGLSIAPNSAIIRTNRARTYLHMGKYDEALEDLNSSLRIDSLQEWPLQIRGLLLLRKDLTEAAEKDFLKLAKISPFNPAAYRGLAQVELRKGNVPNALKYYDEAISTDDDPETRFSRILLKIEANMYSEASEDIRESLDKYPQYGDFYLLRGYLHKLNFRNQEAAIDKKIALEKGTDPKFAEQFIP